MKQKKPEHTSVTILSFRDLNITQSQLAKQLKFFGDLLPDPLSQRIDLEAYSLKLLKLAEIWFAVVNDNEIVGIIVFYANNKQNRAAYIPFISVHPDYQRKGLAKAMIQKVFSIALQKGMTSLWLNVQKENHTAQLLYKSLGFRLTQTESNAWNMHINLSSV